MKCWAFAPPGGLADPHVAEAAKEFCTSVLLGKDWIPRLTVHSFERLRDEMVRALSFEDTIQTASLTVCLSARVSVCVHVYGSDPLELFVASVDCVCVSVCLSYGPVSCHRHSALCLAHAINKCVFSTQHTNVACLHSVTRLGCMPCHAAVPHATLPHTSAHATYPIDQPLPALSPAHMYTLKACSKTQASSRG